MILPPEPSAPTMENPLGSNINQGIVNAVIHYIVNNKSPIRGFGLHFVEEDVINVPIVRYARLLGFCLTSTPRRATRITWLREFAGRPLLLRAWLTTNFVSLESNRARTRKLVEVGKGIAYRLD
jgi:hypothetical protein